MTSTTERVPAVESVGDVFDLVELTTVGIDIGSTTSHAMFGRLRLRRLGQSLSSRFVVVAREVLASSTVTLTPFGQDGLIDTDQLRDFFAAAYDAAGLRPADIDTGAVILTGVALQRHNSAAVAEMFSSWGGRFVCASAGHTLEGMLAAHGCGAVARSAADSARVIHVDIGGGTTKVSSIDCGEIVETAAVGVGARLICFDANGTVVRIEAAATQIAAACGVALAIGQPMSPRNRTRFCAAMADVVLSVVAGRADAGLEAELLLTDPPRPKDLATLAEVSFSGGVSEYMARDDGDEVGNDEVGDLGRELAAAVLDRTGSLPCPARVVDGGLRATVLGASQFTAQVSGNTIHVSDRRLLPLRNLPVVAPKPASWQAGASDLEAAIREAIARMALDATASPLALSLGWRGQPDYRALHALASAVAHGTHADSSRRAVLAVAVHQDIARSLGRILRDELEVACPLVVLDGLELRELDYLDIGEVLEPSGVVPVVIKSLAFPR